MSEVNTKAYELLVSMGSKIKSAETAKNKAKEQEKGAYTIGVEAAAHCADLEEWEVTIGRIEDNIRKNRDNLAVTFGAPKKMKDGKPYVDKQGNKYKVPSSLSTVKSRVKDAFERGVPLDNDGEPRTFNEVLNDINAIKDAEKEQREAEKAAKLKGDDKLRHEAGRYMQTLSDNLKFVEGKELKELHKILKSVSEHARKAAAADGKQSETASEASAGEQLSEAA